MTTNIPNFDNYYSEIKSSFDKHGNKQGKNIIPFPKQTDPSEATNTKIQAQPIEKSEVSTGETFIDRALQDVKSLAGDTVADETAPPEIQEMRKNLMQQWKEADIHPFTLEAASHLLSMREPPMKSGYCLLTWDPKDNQLLHLSITDADAGCIRHHSIKLMGDGRLVFEGSTYHQPSEIYQALTKQTWIPHFPLNLSHPESDVVFLFKNRQFGLAAKKLEENSESLTCKALNQALLINHEPFVSFLLERYPLKRVPIVPANISRECLDLLFKYFPASTQQIAILKQLAEKGAMDPVLEHLHLNPALFSSLDSSDQLHLLASAACFSPTAYQLLADQLKSSHKPQDLIRYALDESIPILPLIEFAESRPAFSYDPPLLRELISYFIESADEKKVIVLKEKAPMLFSAACQSIISRKIKYSPALTQLVLNHAIQHPSISPKNLLVYVMTCYSPGALDFLFKEHRELFQDKSLLLVGIKEASAARQLDALNDLFSKIDDPDLFQAIKPMEKSRAKLNFGTGAVNSFILDHPNEFPLTIREMNDYFGVSIDPKTQPLYTNSEAVPTFWKAMAIQYKEGDQLDFSLSQASWTSLPADEALEVLKTALQEGNWAFIHYIQGLDVKIPAPFLNALFLRALALDEARIIPFLDSQAYFNFEGRFALEKTIQFNRVEYFEILKKTVSLPPVEEQWVQQALAQGKLTLAVKLEGPKAIDDFVSDLDKVPAEHVERQLMTLFLNSSTGEVLKVLEKMANRSAAVRFSHFMATAGSLISRYPDPQSQAEIKKYYGSNYPDYVTQQQAYGTKRYTVYQQAKERLLSDPSCTLIDLYSVLSGAALRNDLFSTWRLSCPSTATQMGYMDGRYGLFLKLAQDYEKRLKIAPQQFQGKATIGTYPTHYTVEYLTDRGAIPLTGFKMSHFAGNRIAMWDHTPPSQIKEGLRVMTDLFEEIRSMKTGFTLPEDLKKKIALFYWLAIQVEPTQRGNSQYALELHHLLWEMHGVKVGPLSPRIGLPDCMGLFVDFEEFYSQHYDNLFESLKS